MWKDPVDLTKRKPRRLRGTPANKVVNLLAFSFVSLFSALILARTHSTDPRVQVKKERLQKKLAPTEEEHLRREMNKDPLMIRITEALNERAVSRAVGETEEQQILEEFINFKK